MAEIKDWGEEPPVAGKKDIKRGKNKEEDAIPKDWQPSQATIDAISMGVSAEEDGEPEVPEEKDTEVGLSQKGRKGMQGKDENTGGS